MLATEVLLRIFGIGPWKNVLINDSVTGREIYTPDSTLGWIAKEGNYLLHPSNPKGNQFHLTIEKDGQRKTGENNEGVDGEFLVIGGSFSQGWGVNDEDTFSSKLQKKHNNFKKKGYPLIQTVKARTRKSAIALAKNEEEEEYQEESLTNKECPMCAETVKAKAKICRYCKYEFE